MRNWTSFLTFLITVHTVYFAMNCYVLVRLSTLFHVKRTPVFYLVVVLLTLSYATSTYLDTFVGNFLTRGLYIIAATWLGVVFLLMSTLIVFEILRPFIRVSPELAGIGVLALVAVLSLMGVINALTLSVKKITLQAPVNMKVVQLSDIHLGSVGMGFVKRIVAKTNSLEPDIVLITGDLFDTHARLGPDTVRFLDDFNAPVFITPGNHERYAGLPTVAELVKTTKATFLRNEAVDFNGIQLIGVDDSDDKQYVGRALKNISQDNSKFSILMHHRPEGFETAADAGIDLMLSGHTHNGQIMPFNLVVRLAHPRIMGNYRLGNALLHVSPGTGTWGPRMRLGSRNEITLIQLENRSK